MYLFHNTTARSVTAVTETKIYFKIAKGVSFGAVFIKLKHGGSSLLGYDASSWGLVFADFSKESVAVIFKASLYVITFSLGRCLQVLSKRREKLMQRNGVTCETSRILDCDAEETPEPAQ